MNFTETHISRLPTELSNLRSLVDVQSSIRLSLSVARVDCDCVICFGFWTESPDRVSEWTDISHRIDRIASSMLHSVCAWNDRHKWSMCVDENSIRSIPSEIGRLTSLSYLNVELNYLTSLPTEIALLTRLTTLIGFAAKHLMQIKNVCAVEQPHIDPDRVHGPDKSPGEQQMVWTGNTPNHECL